MLELLMIAIVLAMTGAIIVLQRQTIKGYQDFINKNINERVIYTANAHYDNTGRYGEEEEEGEIGEEARELTAEDEEGLIKTKKDES